MAFSRPVYCCSLDFACANQCWTGAGTLLLLRASVNAFVSGGLVLVFPLLIGLCLVFMGNELSQLCYPLASDGADIRSFVHAVS